MIANGASAVRVVVVDDSLTRRAYVVRTLQADGDIQVVGQAGSATEASRLVTELRPDVVAVDLQLPGNGGQQAVERIMGRTPTPILALSQSEALTGSSPGIEALRSGALEVMADPGRWNVRQEAEVRRRVRSMSEQKLVHPSSRRVRADGVVPDREAGGPPVRQVVAVAASTGGPNALATVLSGLAGVRAPVLLVQHIHEDFIEGLIVWMQRVSAIPVCLAQSGQVLKPGVAYIGPGGAHLKVDGARRVVLDPQPVSLHRPSADELFFSVARHAGNAGVGVVLTGMGGDGTEGLLALHQAGGFTIAQDRESSAVFGMPQSAEKAGAVSRVLPLDHIAAAIVAATQKKQS